MIKAINATTKGELTRKSVPPHDHCKYIYYGHIRNMPEKYNRYREGNMKWILIYDEDEPNRN